MANHRYSLYGLTFDSAIQCPELGPGDGPADAVVVYGEVPDSLPEVRQEGALYQVAPGKLRLAIDHIGKYLVSDGREIVVEPAPDADPDALRVVLLGSAMGALLLQRGVLPLHASAIEVDGGCVAFAAPSGHGKSTLAAAFHRRGYRVFADDVLAVRAGGGPPLAYPSYPELRLWTDSLAKLELAGEELRRVRPELEKSRLPVASPATLEPLPLDRLYFLGVTHEGRFELEPVTGMEKLDALFWNTYRYQFLEGLGTKSAHFELCVAVSRHTALRKVSRPQDAFRLDELVALIERDFGR